MSTSNQEFFERVYPFLRKTSENSLVEEIEREREFLFNQMYPDRTKTTDDDFVANVEALNKVREIETRYLKVIDTLIWWRSEFRENGEWSRADEIRDLLAKSGIKVYDKMHHTYWEWMKEDK